MKKKKVFRKFSNESTVQVNLVVHALSEVELWLDRKTQVQEPRGVLRLILLAASVDDL